MVSFSMDKELKRIVKSQKVEGGTVEGARGLGRYRGTDVLWYLPHTVSFRTPNLETTVGGELI